MTELHFKRFIKTIAITSAIVFFTICTVNIVIDPFRLFSFPGIPGFNVQKPEYGKHVRMAKAHEVRVLKPSGLILGSSRTEFGLDPDHPGWDDSAETVYNLALPSCRIYEAYKYLQHANTVNQVKQVVLAVDMFMFDATRETESGFSDTRLASVNGSGNKLIWLSDLFISVFSYDAIQASWKTLSTQDDNCYVPYLHNGMRHPTRNWNRIRKKGGHHKAFLSNESYSITASDGWRYFNLVAPDGITYPGLDIFRKLVKICRNNNIELRVLISPIHARKLEVMWQVGMWKTFELWKRELQKIITEDTVTHPNQFRYELWDFSGYSTINSEKVPGVGDIDTQMQWYWEGSHYKKIVGDMMLDKIFRFYRISNRRVVPDDFGVLLKSENVTYHLDSQRRLHDRYISENPDDIEEISKLIEESWDKHY